jgi:hypothetical protein
MGALKVKDQTTGLWIYVGTPGPAGPTGPTGPMGVSTVIVGDFGAQTTPADLPVDGLLPVDWDGPGQPAVAHQMNLGESLYYDKATDPTLDGHLFQYVSTAVDPTGWIDVGLIQGPKGDTGPTSTVPGPTGATGPTGPPLPPGGKLGSPLIKLTDADQDVKWGEGESFVTVGWRGAFQFNEGASSGGGLFWRGSDMATQALVLREPVGGLVRVSDNNGSNERTILDAVNILGTANNVVYENGFSGTMDFRVSPAMVTMRMVGVKSSNSYLGGDAATTHVRICPFPAGVPGPWAGPLVEHITLHSSSGWGHTARYVMVHVETNGVYLNVYGGGANVDYNANDQISCTVTWAR